MLLKATVKGLPELRAKVSTQRPGGHLGVPLSLLQLRGSCLTLQVRGQRGGTADSFDSYLSSIFC